MSQRRVGFVISGNSVILVDAKIPMDQGDPIEIIGDHTWPLQKGDRPAAYDVMYNRCSNFLNEAKVDSAIVKASATSKSTTLSHLNSAELRGVIIAAAAGVCPVRTLAKGVISRTYGNRKVDEYLKDDDFWAKSTTGGNLRKASREAMMILIASRGS